MRFWSKFLPVYLICGAILTFETRQPRAADSVQTARAPKIQGELIDPAPASTQAVQSVVQTNANQRRYASPGSTQKRMVMFEMKMNQLVDEQPVSGPSNAIPAGILAGVTQAPELVPSGYKSIGFDKLSAFNFVLTDDVVNGASATNQNAGATAPPSQIPADIQKLDGNRVGIRGFLLPVRMDDGLAVEFLLMRDRSFCCYGSPPKINQWITVHTRGRGVKPLMDQPVTILGTLHVGEKRENGFLVGIYEMDAEKVLELPQ